MANYAHIENNTISGVYDLVPDNWRNISNFYVLYDSEPELVHDMGWRTIVKTIVTYDPNNQRLSDPTYSIVDGQVIENIPVIDIIKEIPLPDISYTEEELLSIQINKHNDFMVRLRTKRDRLLSETDFTQLPDVMARNGVELTQAFVVYREQLRNLPASYESDISYYDDSQVTFPSIPTPDNSQSNTDSSGG